MARVGDTHAGRRRERMAHILFLQTDEQTE